MKQLIRLHSLLVVVDVNVLEEQRLTRKKFLDKTTEVIADISAKKLLYKSWLANLTYIEFRSQYSEAETVQGETGKNLKSLPSSKTHIVIF